MAAVTICMKSLAFALLIATAGISVEPPHPATNPESPVMLAGTWLPDDPHRLDFYSLPRVPSEHVVINDVTVKNNAV